MSTHIDAEELFALAKGGMCATEIAEEIGVDCNAVRRAARRHAVALRNGVHERRSPVQKLRADVGDMKPLDAVEFLLAILEDLINADDQSCIWPGIHLPNSARRVCQALYSREGALLSRDYLMTALYGGQADPPSGNVIYVFVTKARAALRGTGFEIKTVRGQGYRMQRKRGVVFPWETTP